MKQKVGVCRRESMSVEDGMMKGRLYCTYERSIYRHHVRRRNARESSWHLCIESRDTVTKKRVAGMSGVVRRWRADPNPVSAGECGVADSNGVGRKTACNRTTRTKHRPNPSNTCSSSSVEVSGTVSLCLSIIDGHGETPHWQEPPVRNSGRRRARSSVTISSR